MRGCRDNGDSGNGVENSGSGDGGSSIDDTMMSPGSQAGGIVDAVVPRRNGGMGGSDNSSVAGSTLRRRKTRLHLNTNQKVKLAIKCSMYSTILLYTPYSRPHSTTRNTRGSRQLIHACPPVRCTVLS